MSNLGDDPERTGNLFLDASDEPARRRAAEWQRLQATPLAQATLPGHHRPHDSWLQRLDDHLRVFGNEASFGAADHLEGLANSTLHGAPTNDSMSLSQIRTEMAQRRLEEMAEQLAQHVVGPHLAKTVGKSYGQGLRLAGGVAGYGATLPFLPAWLAGIGRGKAITPAAIPLEATRGYLTSPGSPGERMHGAARGAFGDPTAMFNPMRARTLAASTFGEPAMEHAGLGDYTPSGYANSLLSSLGIE